MDYRGMESEFGSGRRFQAAARKLLAGNKAEPTPATLAPSPVPSAYMCRDVKTGAIVSCQNPHTLVIIVAGMSCMMFLVTVAMLLLCWSVVRQRRIERRRRESDVDGTQTSSGNPNPNPAVAPVDSPEFDDAVFVQLPGDEKPHYFALPKPFLDDVHLPVVKTLPEENTPSGEKEQSVQEQSGELRDSNSVTVQEPCNPPFAPPT